MQKIAQVSHRNVAQSALYQDIDCSLAIDGGVGGGSGLELLFSNTNWGVARPPSHRIEGTG